MNLFDYLQTENREKELEELEKKIENTPFPSPDDIARLKDLKGYSKRKKKQPKGVFKKRRNVGASGGFGHRK